MIALPMLMVATGLLVAGFGLLGVSGRLDTGALRWLGIAGPTRGGSPARGATGAIFALVALSGSLLALGGLLDL